MISVLSASGIVAALVEWSSKWTYVMFGALLLMIIMGTWAGAVAARKGRSMQAWFLIGFFVPVIGLIIIYAIKPGSAPKADGGKTAGQPGSQKSKPSAD